MGVGGINCVVVSYFFTAREHGGGDPTKFTLLTHDRTLF